MVESINKYFYPLSILDIGANLGQFYLECKNYFPNSYYFLVEPNPQCLSFLQESKCDYLAGAFSNEESKKPFYMSKAMHACTGNSFYREQTDFFSDDNLEVINIDTVLMDNYFKSKNIKRFDLIKMDTQGSELDILKGGKELASKALGIILEVSVSEYNKNAPMANEVFKYMDEMGFEKMEKVGSNNNPLTYELVHEDYLFINRNIL